MEEDVFVTPRARPTNSPLEFQPPLPRTTNWTLTSWLRRRFLDKTRGFLVMSVWVAAAGHQGCGGVGGLSHAWPHRSDCPASTSILSLGKWQEAYVSRRALSKTSSERFSYLRAPHQVLFTWHFKGSVHTNHKKNSIILSLTASAILSYVLPFQKDYFFARMSFSNTHNLHSFTWLTFIKLPYELDICWIHKKSKEREAVYHSELVSSVSRAVSGPNWKLGIHTTSTGPLEQHGPGLVSC